MKKSIKKLSSTKFVTFNLVLFFHLSAFSYCLTNAELKKWQTECARYEALLRSVENACATAGNIDRCIQIKMQGQGYHTTSYEHNCLLTELNVGFLELDKINKKPLGSSCREANTPKKMPYNFSIQDIGK